MVWLTSLGVECCKAFAESFQKRVRLRCQVAP
jgi:hypothetical protein